MKRKESELPKRYGRKGRNGIGDDVMMGENVYTFLLLLFSFFFLDSTTLFNKSILIAGAIIYS
jgi:hypothetical protein